MIKQLISIYVISMGCLLLPVHATTGADAFLDDNPSAKYEALGGSHVAISQGSVPGFTNPAGLPYLTGTTITVAKSTVLGVVDRQYAGLAIPLFQKLGLGVGFLRSGVDDIKHTTESGVDTGSRFKFIEQALFFSLGVDLLANLKTGVTYKVVEKTSGAHQAKGQGLDVGVMWSIADTFWIGAQATHLLRPKLEWNTPSKSVDVLESDYQVGVGFQIMDQLLISADYSLETKEKQAYYRAGIASTLLDFDTIKVFARAGIKKNNLSFGLGFIADGLSVDYAYKTYQQDYLDKGHIFSASLRL